VAPGDAEAARLAALSVWARAPSSFRYGPGTDAKADLLLPDGAGAGPHRLAVLIHGGFWRARYGREMMAALAGDLADRGWATWNVEYRRVGAGGGVPATLDDVRAAIGFLGDGLDAPVEGERVLAIGHSAGGQLALWAARLPRVAAVVSLAGVCDLASAARERIGDGAVLAFAGGTPSERPDAYAAADPIALLPTGARTLLVHGDADRNVPIAQSRAYARAAVAAGDRCELLELAGVDHFDVIDPRTPAWAAVAERLEPMLAPAS
jgi:acetyl esterase/lipase